MSHIPATKVTTRDGRRHFKVLCSCGHCIIADTDSQNTASDMILTHQRTPECPECHHRNVHKPITGCTFETDPLDAADQRGCMCGFGQSETPNPRCPYCGHTEHGTGTCHEGAVTCRCNRNNH